MNKNNRTNNRASKKIELAKKSNSKVLICNTPEAKILAELIPNIDIVYKFLRTNVGTQKVDMEYFQEKQSDILFMAKKINSFINEIAKENDIKNIKEVIIEDGK